MCRVRRAPALRFLYVVVRLRDEVNWRAVEAVLSQTSVTRVTRVIMVVGGGHVHGLAEQARRNHKSVDVHAMDERDPQQTLDAIAAWNRGDSHDAFRLVK